MPLEFQAAAGGTLDTVDGEVTGPAVTPDVVAAFGGTTAARMRAKHSQLRARTREFPMPPADVWGDDLVLVAKPVKIEDGMTNVEVIAEATTEIRLRGDDGQLRAVPEDWAGLGRLMGVVSDDPDGPPVSVGQIITAVCSSREIVGALADDIIAFTLGRRSRIAQALGE